MAMTATTVATPTIISRSRFALGKFFILTHLFREEALQREPHISVAACRIHLWRRKAQQGDAIGLHQTALKIRFGGNGCFEVVDLCPRLRAGIDSFDRHDNLFSRSHPLGSACLRV